jgi:hypothetical protein
MTVLGRHGSVLLIFVASLPSWARARPQRVAVVDDGVASAPELEHVVSAVADATRRAGSTALGPDEVRGELQLDGALLTRRKAAETALGEAKGLVANVRYDDALVRLSVAEREAQAGLAGLAVPRLLAEIYLQRGLALLATDDAAAQRWLLLSFQLWPGRTLDPYDHAPRILQVLQQTERGARAARPNPRLRESDASRLARLVHASAVLAVDAYLDSDQSRVRVTVRRFDAGRGVWSGSVSLDWAAGASNAAVDEALQPVAGLLPQEAPGNRLDPGRTWGWVLLGVSAVTLATGIGLTVHAMGQIDEARGLAKQTQPVEYFPRVSDLEDQADRSRTGAIISYAIGAVSVAAGLYLLLRGDPPRREAPVALRTGGAGLAWTW